MRTSSPSLLAFLALALLASAAGPGAAGVFDSKESALRAAFPDADRVAPRDLFVTPDEAEQVKKLAGVRLKSRLVTAYAGYSGDRLLGWAFLDTHTVRTLPETVMLVVTPRGTVSATRLLAFHEPPEHQPPAGWLERFAGASLDEDLRPGGRVDSLSGSTLSAQAVTATVRRLLAVWQVMLAPAPKTGPAP